MARVLVADDEEGVRTFLAEVLELDGHEVTAVPDGAAAARALQGSSFDLLVTDLKMPGLDGLGLVARVKAEQPEVEVLVLTAYATVDTAVEAMKLGAFDYLQKPVHSPAALRLLVSRALERRRLLAARDRERLEAPGEPRLTWGDPAMTAVVEALRKVARTRATVLLTGESGVGKEVAARAIHEWSDRAEGPFVAVNCAVLAENLLESELFGHEKGAFTGAVAGKRGRIELAAGGTFFLDEVGELAPPLQAKLLRVLQQRTFERVGGERSLQADVRWIAATNRDLLALIEAGQFREDLYHRLAVFPVHIPPLRARRRDIVPLARTLLADIARELGVPGLRLTPDAEAALEAGEWRGNVRGLRNTLERAAILADGGPLDPAFLSERPVGAATSLSIGGTLEDLERQAIVAALAAADGNRRQAAERLGIGLRTLYDKLKRYAIG
jgi:two-component system response regulator FlrC